MNLFKRLILILLCAATLPAVAHDFHISKGRIEYNAEQQELQITLHLFIDDLEKALQQAGAPKLFLATERELPQATSYLTQYLRRHFQLQLDGQPAAWNLVGFEPSDDLSAIWVYLQLDTPQAPAQLELRYDALTEVYADQKNIIQLLGPNQQREVLLFDRHRPGGQVKFAK